MFRKEVITTCFILGVGLLFSFFTASAIQRFENQAIEHEVQKDVENAAYSFSRELNIAVELLHSLRSQIAIFPHLNHATFNRLSSRVVHRLPEILSVKWIDYVPSEMKLDYEKKLFNEEKISFLFQYDSTKSQNVPVGSRETYFPIRYVYPEKDARAFTGLDLASNLNMLDSLEISWYRNIPFATLGLWLKRDFGEKNGFIVLLPVFHGEPKTDIEQKNSLQGFLFTVIDIRKIFNLTLGKTVSPFLNLSLVDQDGKNRDQILFQQNENTDHLYDSKLKYDSNPIYFAGREWILKGMPSNEFVHHRLTIFPYLAFALGMFIFSLIAFLIYSLQNRTKIILQRVDLKTAELREANRKLEGLSKCDGLTGLYNKNYFINSLDNELNRAHRDRLILSIMIIEIDGLIYYNEVKGRIAGNNVIRLIGQAISDELKRPSDLIARFDGGKFAILLPNTKQGIAIGERCIEATKQLKLTVFPDEDMITLSIGGVTISNFDGIDCEKLITLAENALSKAIVQGRDQVSWGYFPETTRPLMREVDLI